MAGHSKWANIKHRKERQDKKRGKVWSKCSRAIIASARAGGPDPETNLTLRYAIDEAKYANMPKDTIQRAVQKGAGSAGGDAFESVTYEGYGPSGIAVIVDTLTDNNTRTVSEVRNIFNKSGGNMGNSGSVAYMFDTKGQILVEGRASEDAVMEAALEAGAEDIESPDGDDGFWTVVTDPIDFLKVQDAIKQAGLTITEAEISKIPQTTIEVGGDDVRKLMNLIDNLEDNDDVQKVYTNADIPDDELDKLD